MTKPKIVYFDARGLAEPSRLILHHADVEFDDVRLSNEEWLALKSGKAKSISLLLQETLQKPKPGRFHIWSTMAIP